MLGAPTVVVALICGAGVLTWAAGKECAAKKFEKYIRDAGCACVL